MADVTSDPIIEDRPAQPYVAVAARVGSEAEFRRAADQGFPRVFGWLRERGVTPAGPPFIRYRAFTAAGDPVQVEIAVPVRHVVEGDDGIEAALLPAGEWVTLVHRGPYTHASEPDLAAAHATVRAWIDEHELALVREESADGETVLRGCVEQYRVGPVDDPDYRRWETEIAYLIERPAE